MDVRLAAAVADPELNVRAWCRQHRISRSTFYKWKARFAVDGLDGLQERSRRPKRSAHAVSVDVEERIVRFRKELADRGWDHGADQIHDRLMLDVAGGDVPSRATIWRVLGRRGLVDRQPSKRPKSAWRRFEWGRPNECWQIDATHWTLSSDTVVEIINIIDDHSRVLIASVAVPVTTSTAAWAAFMTGAHRWGLPGHVLSDNGLAFTARPGHRDVTFTANLRALGIKPIHASPHHPQTCGKVERFHQTLKKWLDQHSAASICQLQGLLDTFAEHYNHQRPHRACHRRPPIEKWRATAPAGPANRPVDTPTIITTGTVTSRGRVDIAGYAIALGTAYAGRHVTLMLQAGHVVVFDHNTLIYQLDIDPSHYYQRRYNTTGRPPDSVRNVPRHNCPR